MVLDMVTDRHKKDTEEAEEATKGTIVLKSSTPDPLSTPERSLPLFISLLRQR